MVNLADIDKFFTESDKIKHLVKYLGELDALLKKQEETISSLSASQESMSNILQSVQEHVSSHDKHLSSHDKHLQTHDQRLDMRK